MYIKTVIFFCSIISKQQPLTFTGRCLYRNIKKYYFNKDTLMVDFYESSFGQNKFILSTYYCISLQVQREWPGIWKKYVAVLDVMRASNGLQSFQTKVISANKKQTLKAWILVVDSIDGNYSVVIFCYCYSQSHQNALLLVHEKQWWHRGWFSAVLA